MTVTPIRPEVVYGGTAPYWYCPGSEPGKVYVEIAITHPKTGAVQWMCLEPSRHSNGTTCKHIERARRQYGPRGAPCPDCEEQVYPAWIIRQQGDDLTDRQLKFFVLGPETMGGKYQFRWNPPEQVWEAVRALRFRGTHNLHLCPNAPAERPLRSVLPSPWPKDFDPLIDPPDPREVGYPS